MDPLFERRELTKKVNVPSKYLAHNIQNSLLIQLKTRYQGTCSAEGYINKDSIVVTSHSAGRPNLISGGVDYSVTFQSDVCLPHAGQKFRGAITLKSKIGLHIEMSPLKILIPRDLHIGRKEYEDANEGDEIEFLVIGSPQFKQGDDSIIVVGRLPESLTPKFSPFPTEEVQEVIPELNLNGSGGGGEKRVVVVQPPTRKLTKKQEL